MRDQQTSELAQDANAHSAQGMVSPPDGFRMLTEGERTKRGDVFYMFGKWLPVKGYNAKWNPRQYWPMARRANDKVSDGGTLTHESKQDANPPFAAATG